MAELENELEDSIDEIEYTTTEDDDIELTVDDYQKEKARREKAEKTLVELKKQLKEKSETPNPLTETDLEIRDFVKENPEYKDYKKEISDAIAKGYSLKQAKALIDNDDKTIENRKKLNSMNMTDWDGELSKTTYTKAELDDPNLSQEKYDSIMAKIKSWKAKLK